MTAICLCALLGIGLAAAGGYRNPDSSSRSGPSDKYAFALKDLAGGDEEITKAALTEEKPLVLVTWAPDCPYCIRDMPYIAALYKKLDKEQAGFATIAFSDSKSEVRKFVEEKELSFPVLWDGSGTFGEGFEYDGYPTTYIFRKGGKLQEIVESDGTAYIADVLAAVESAAKP